MIFYRESMLEAALQPGYPMDSAEGAILSIIANRLGIDTEMEETREQIDTKVFITLPYAFASHKVSLAMAPVIRWMSGKMLMRSCRDDSTHSSMVPGFTETCRSAESPGMRKSSPCSAVPTRSCRNSHPTLVWLT